MASLLHNGWRFLVSSILGWLETVSLRVGRAICISCIWGSAWTDLDEMLHSTSDVERGHTGIHSSLRGTPSTFSLDLNRISHMHSRLRLKNLTSHLHYSSLPRALSFVQDPFRGLWKASPFRLSIREWLLTRWSQVSPMIAWTTSPTNHPHSLSASSVTCSVRWVDLGGVGPGYWSLAM